MPYNSVADSVYTKKLSSSELHFLTENGHFAFLSPLWQRMMFILGSLVSS